MAVGHPKREGEREKRGGEREKREKGEDRPPLRPVAAGAANRGGEREREKIEREGGCRPLYACAQGARRPHGRAQPPARFRRRSAPHPAPAEGRRRRKKRKRKRKRKRKKGIDLKRKDVFVQLSLFRKTYIIYTVLVITHPQNQHEHTSF